MRNDTVGHINYFFKLHKHYWLKSIEHNIFETILPLYRNTFDKRRVRVTVVNTLKPRAKMHVLNRKNVKHAPNTS